MATNSAIATTSSERYIAMYEKVESALTTNGFAVYFDYLKNVSKTTNSYDYFLKGNIGTKTDTAIVKFNAGSEDYTTQRQVLSLSYDLTIGLIFFSKKTGLKLQTKDAVYKRVKLMIDLLQFQNTLGFNSLKLVNFDASSNCLNEFNIKDAPLKSSDDMFAFKLKFKFTDFVALATQT